MLNAQPGIPDREGITYETAFVGHGMRRHPRLNYIPSRLSLLPVVIRDYARPDAKEELVQAASEFGLL